MHCSEALVIHTIPSRTSIRKHPLAATSQIHFLAASALASLCSSIIIHLTPMPPIPHTRT